MENLIILKKPNEKYFPSIFFDAETGHCEIAGESFMEEPFKFYAPLIDWITKYINSDKKSITFVLKLNYFNTRSSKMLLEIFKLLKEFSNNGAKVEINWYYDPSDDDMKMELDDFKAETGLAINKISFES